jgi:hypothetical protein
MPACRCSRGSHEQSWCINEWRAQDLLLVMPARAMRANSVRGQRHDTREKSCRVKFDQSCVFDKPRQVLRLLSCSHALLSTHLRAARELVRAYEQYVSGLTCVKSARASHCEHTVSGTCDYSSYDAHLRV